MRDAAADAAALGYDPAIIAGVFDTMLTDLLGFYLGLATIFISQIAK